MPLSDGSYRSLVLEHVAGGLFSSARWRLVGVGPGKSMRLEQIVDTYVFSPKEAASAASLAAKAEFVLHVTPLGAAADYAIQGDYKEAAISLASDATMLMTGGASKALSATRAAKSLRVTESGLRATGIVVQGSVAGIRGWQGSVKLASGEGGHGEIAEAILRLFGVRYSLSSKVDAAASVARQSNAAGVASRVVAPKSRAPISHIEFGGQGVGGRTLFEEALRKFPGIKEIHGVAELDNSKAFRATNDISKTPFALSLRKLGFTRFEVLEVGCDIVFIAGR